jgi:hypothetical protein
MSKYFEAKQTNRTKKKKKQVVNIQNYDDKK